MIDINELEAIVFDFDGVLTDNKVYVNENGQETVCCSRADGLAFDVLRQFHLKMFILSTETNHVVAQRGKKLGIPVYHGTTDKKAILHDLSKEENFKLLKTLFVGNDLNDYLAMSSCGFSACPKDSHIQIAEMATFCLQTRGGQGVIRELVEKVFEIDMLQYMIRE